MLGDLLCCGADPPSQDGTIEVHQQRSALVFVHRGPSPCSGVPPGAGSYPIVLRTTAKFLSWPLLRSWNSQQANAWHSAFQVARGRAQETGGPHGMERATVVLRLESVVCSFASRRNHGSNPTYPVGSSLGNAVIWGTDEYIHTYLPHWRVACEDHRQRLSRHADSSYIGVGITSLSPFQSASSYLALKRCDVANAFLLAVWNLVPLLAHVSLALVVDLGSTNIVDILVAV